MRKIVVSTFVTLDGVIEAPEKWSFDFHSEDNMNQALELVLGSGALLLGRRTYEGFAAAWPSREDPMGFADKMNSMPKHVVSTTLETADWNNTTIISTDVIDQVRDLKEQPGDDILMYGSATLMRSLMDHDLIDDYRFLLNPVLVGDGARLFPNGQSKTLKLAGSTAFSGGMVALDYQPSTAA